MYGSMYVCMDVCMEGMEPTPYWAGELIESLQALNIRLQALVNDLTSMTLG